MDPKYFRPGSTTMDLKYFQVRSSSRQFQTQRLRPRNVQVFFHNITLTSVFQRGSPHSPPFHSLTRNLQFLASSTGTIPFFPPFFSFSFLLNSSSQSQYQQATLIMIWYKQCGKSILHVSTHLVSISSTNSSWHRGTVNHCDALIFQPDRNFWYFQIPKLTSPPLKPREFVMQLVLQKS